MPFLEYALSVEYSNNISTKLPARRIFAPHFTKLVTYGASVWNSGFAECWEIDAF